MPRGVLEPSIERQQRSVQRLRSSHRPTFIAPSDNLVWERTRIIERLFGFRYRVEIYVPQHKRQYATHFGARDVAVGRTHPSSVQVLV